MRAIDADAYIEYVQRVFFDAVDADTTDDGVRLSMFIMTGLISDLKNENITPTIEPEPKWIPCSERLPEEKINPNTQDYDWVLCSTTFGDVRTYHFGRGRFLHGCGDVTQYVTAWMPLPEAYREDEE